MSLRQPNTLPGRFGPINHLRSLDTLHSVEITPHVVGALCSPLSLQVVQGQQHQLEELVRTHNQIQNEVGGFALLYCKSVAAMGCVGADACVCNEVCTVHGLPDG